MKVFADAALASGVDGVLTVDLPPGKLIEVAALFKRAAGRDFPAVRPPTTLQAAARSCRHASGYVY